MGLSLWLGNNPDAEIRPVGFMHPISSSAERERYIELGETAYMKAKKDEALGYMVSHPGRALSLAVARFVSFWSGGTSHPLDDFLQKRSFWFRYVLLFNVLAALSCLAGIVVLVRRRSIYALPLASLPIVFPCIYYLTVVTPRYRLPVDPVVLLLAAIVFGTLVREPSRSGSRIRLHPREWKPVSSSTYTMEDQQRMTRATNYFEWQRSWSFLNSAIECSR